MEYFLTNFILNLSLILLPAVPVLPVGAVVVLVHSLQPADIVVTVSHQVDVQLVRLALRTSLEIREHHQPASAGL